MRRDYDICQLMKEFSKKGETFFSQNIFKLNNISPLTHLLLTVQLN